MIHYGVLMAKFVGREPRFLPTFPVTEEAANRLSTTPAIGMNSAAIATYTLTVDSVPSSGGLSMCLAIARRSASNNHGNSYPRCAITPVKQPSTVKVRASHIERPSRT